MDIENRLNGVEESVRTIAKYVKSEMERVSKYSGPDTDEIRGIVLSEMDKKLANSERNMRAQISRIEELVTKSGRTLTDKGMQQYVDKINAMRNELNNALERMEGFKREITDLEGTETSKRDIEPLMTSVKSIGSKLILLEGRLGSFVTTSDLDNFRKTLGLERIDKLIESRLEEKSEPLMAVVKDAEAKFEYLDKGLSRVKDFIEETETHNKAYENELEGMEQRMRTIEVTKSALEAVDFKNLLKDIRELKTRMEQHNIDMASVDKNIDDLEDKLEGIERNSSVEQLKKMASEVAGLKKTIETKSSEKTSIFDSGDYRKISNDIQSLRKSLEKITRDNDFFMKKVQNKVEIIEAARPDDIGKMGHVMDKYAKILDEKEKAINTMTRRMADMEQSMKELEINMGTEESMKGISKNEKQNMRNNIENSNMAIASLSKGMHDIEKELEEIKQRKEGAKHDMSKDVYQTVNKLVVKNFEEFAKVMDRKMPRLMTRDEHVRHMEELNKKMDSIQAPDLSGLARRMDMVEQKLEEISTFIQGVYNKMPVIVE